ncbi:MAG: DUF302 domain-containing protein [Sulfuricurvum sp.]|nr:DUF302 domain-containing protein [Sulfuricurvum sp.]
MKAIVLVILAGLVSLFGGDLHLFSTPNSDGKITPNMIEKAFEANGFTIAADSEMTGPFNKQFGKSDFSVFNLMTVIPKKEAAMLVKSHPDGGIFVPMGVGIYQRKGDSNLHVSVLTADAMQKIAGFKASEFALIEKEVFATLKTVIPKAKHTLSEKSLPSEGKLLSRFVKPTDVKNWQSDKDDTEMMIEEGLKPAGFVLSNFTDYQFMLTESGEESPFSFYDTYSICKLKVIYTVAQTHPEAAAFAPCTLMVYKKKDAAEIVMGFPGVYNWMSSARVDNAEAKEVLLQAQKDFEAVLQSTIE